MYFTCGFLLFWEVSSNLPPQPQLENILTYYDAFIASTYIKVLLSYLCCFTWLLEKEKAANAYEASQSV